MKAEINALFSVLLHFLQKIERLFDLHISDGNFLIQN